ncbi:MAG: PIG-L deacetylase family protein [Anaerolineae bacterium]
MTSSDFCHIYLSPHLDDAVLSCGGAIWEYQHSGQAVLAASFFSASPAMGTRTDYIRELEARWGGAQDPVAVRRQEDLNALRVLGAKALHLAYLDCVYRQDTTTREYYYATEESIFGEVHPAEEKWHDELLDGLTRLVGDLGEVQIHAPLAAGHHVDHILVRRVAHKLQARGLCVDYYEDWPYAGDRTALEQALAPWPAGLRTSQTMELGLAALRAKVEAVGCYTSQLSTFWDDLDAMRRAVEQQAYAVGRDRPCERSWQVPLLGLER